MSTVLDQSTVPAGSSPATGTGVPAGPPPASGVTGAPPAPGSVGAPPAPSDSVGLQQLRQQYETTKNRLAQYERFGQPDELSQRMEQLAPIASMHTEAQRIGQQLGYTAEEIQTVFAQDPARTLAFLRQKANTPQTIDPQNLHQTLERMLQEQMKPIQNHFNEQLTQEAETRLNGEFDRLFKAQYKDGLPDECREALFDLVSAAMGEDQEALNRLKFGRQTSDIARHFQEQHARFLKIVNAWSAFDKSRTGNLPANPQNPPDPAKPKSAMDVKLSTGQTVRDLWKGL